jgi:hypothetical protein
VARRRNPIGRDAFERVRRDISDAQAESSTSGSLREPGSAGAVGPPGGAGRRPGESQDDYLYRIMFGGDIAEREQAQERQRAGRAATAARYGESEGNYVSEWQFPDSSRVRAYQWDEARQQLRVRFIKYSTPWVYNNVPLETFQAFDASDSKGRFINRVLNNFPYRRASADEVARHFQGV